MKSGKNTFVVLDFETTGLSPQNGDQAIEVGAVLVKNGKVSDKYQSLINPGKKVSSFIEDYTGITNEMLSDARESKVVMKEFFDFIGLNPLVAHNMSFDKRFLEMELGRIGKNHSGLLGCSLLLSRRVFPELKSHNLASLISFCKIEKTGDFHRALADSHMTANLWLELDSNLRKKYKLDSLRFEEMVNISHTPKSNVDDYVERVLKRTQVC